MQQFFARFSFRKRNNHTAYTFSASIGTISRGSAPLFGSFPSDFAKTAEIPAESSHFGIFLSLNIQKLYRKNAVRMGLPRRRRHHFRFLSFFLKDYTVPPCATGRPRPAKGSRRPGPPEYRCSCPARRWGSPPDAARKVPCAAIASSRFSFPCVIASAISIARNAAVHARTQL